MAEKLVTATPFRGSFVALTKPSLPQGETDESKARFQITIALPKKNKFWKQVSKEIEAVAAEKWGKVPAKMTRPVKDGDDIVDDDGNPKYPEFEGCYTLQASTKNRPGVVDRHLQPITDPDELYSGAWYRATVRAFAWEHPTGGKGVSFALDNVQKVKDDDPLGGAGPADKDFASFKEDDDEDSDAEGLLD